MKALQIQPVHSQSNLPVQSTSNGGMISSVAHKALEWIGLLFSSLAAFVLAPYYLIINLTGFGYKPSAVAPPKASTPPQLDKKNILLTVLGGVALLGTMYLTYRFFTPPVISNLTNQLFQPPNETLATAQKVPVTTPPYALGIGALLITIACLYHSRNSSKSVSVEAGQKKTFNAQLFMHAFQKLNMASQSEWWKESFLQAINTALEQKLRQRGKQINLVLPASEHSGSNIREKIVNAINYWVATFGDHRIEESEQKELFNNAFNSAQSQFKEVPSDNNSADTAAHSNEPVEEELYSSMVVNQEPQEAAAAVPEFAKNPAGVPEEIEGGFILGGNAQLGKRLEKEGRHVNKANLRRKRNQGVDLSGKERVRALVMNWKKWATKRVRGYVSEEQQQKALEPALQFLIDNATIEKGSIRLSVKGKITREQREVIAYACKYWGSMDKESSQKMDLIVDLPEKTDSIVVHPLETLTKMKLKEIQKELGKLQNDNSIENAAQSSQLAVSSSSQPPLPLVTDEFAEQLMNCLKEKNLGNPSSSSNSALNNSIKVAPSDPFYKDAQTLLDQSDEYVGSMVVRDSVVSGLSDIIKEGLSEEDPSKGRTRADKVKHPPIRGDQFNPPSVKIRITREPSSKNLHIVIEHLQDHDLQQALAEAAAQ